VKRRDLAAHLGVEAGDLVGGVLGGGRHLGRQVQAELGNLRQHRCVVRSTVSTSCSARGGAWPRFAVPRQGFVADGRPRWRGLGSVAPVTI
jgi:hypothetical protein